MTKKSNYGLYVLSGLAIGYCLGDYLGTNRRYGANSLVANAYNNNYFIYAKESFL
jgi:hypothetical protein